MPRPIDFIFNDIDDLLELSEYALMLISSNQAVNLAYVVFAKNPILLQDLWAWPSIQQNFAHGMPSRYTFTKLNAYGTNMKVTAKGQLRLSALSPSAQAAIFLDDLKTGTLKS